jgi:hypothetical protein
MIDTKYRTASGSDRIRDSTDELMRLGACIRSLPLAVLNSFPFPVFLDTLSNAERGDLADQR